MDTAVVSARVMLLFCCFFASASAEPVIGQFELKTLDSTAGGFEFQSQNAWSSGQPSRQMASNGPDDIELDENAVIRERYALELEMGFTSFVKMRIGIEFENERIGEPQTIEQANDFGGLSLTDIGAEVVVVLRQRHGDGAGAGLAAEIDTPVDRQESSQLGLGPVIEFQSGPWFAAAVPMVVRALGGEAGQGDKVDDKWDFTYAAQLMYKLSGSWSLALESYGTIERLGNSGHPSESAQLFGDFDQHRAGAVIYYTHDFGGSQRVEAGTEGSLLSDSGEEEERTSLTAGFGLLEGLNENTPQHTLKFSIEIHF